MLWTGLWVLWTSSKLVGWVNGCSTHQHEPQLQENWIRVLVAAQIVIFLLSLFTSKHSTIQGLIFFCSGTVDILDRKQLLGLLSSWCCQVVDLHNIFLVHAASVIFLAETLNRLGSKYWQFFSKQDYFDQRGVFFTAVVSGPLVIDMLVVLVSILIAGMTSYSDQG
jgi:hypothetical protein